jgi:hypothetical protein
MARQQQPAGAWIAGATSAGHPLVDYSSSPLFVKVAGVADQSGTVYPSLDNGGFNLAIGDLLVYEGPSLLPITDSSLFTHYPANSLPSNEDVVTFGVASTRSLSPSETLTGGKFGIYNGTSSDAPLPAVVEHSRSISVDQDTLDCDNVVPISNYCHGGSDESLLKSIQYPVDTTVANAVVNNYLVLLPNNNTLHSLGSHNSRSGVNEFRVASIYLHSSTQDVFTQNGTEYKLNASYVWETATVSTSEARGRHTGIYIPSSPGAFVAFVQGSTTYASDADRTSGLNSLISNAVEYSWNYLYGSWSGFKTTLALSGLAIEAVYPSFDNYSCGDGWTIVGEYREDSTSGSPLPVNPVVGLSYTVYE